MKICLFIDPVSAHIWGQGAPFSQVWMVGLSPDAADVDHHQVWFSGKKQKTPTDAIKFKLVDDEILRQMLTTLRLTHVDAQGILFCWFEIYLLRGIGEVLISRTQEARDWVRKVRDASISESHCLRTKPGNDLSSGFKKVTPVFFDMQFDLISVWLNVFKYFNHYYIILLFKGCRPCRRPRKNGQVGKFVFRFC